MQSVTLPCGADLDYFSLFCPQMLEFLQMTPDLIWTHQENNAINCWQTFNPKYGVVLRCKHISAALLLISWRQLLLGRGFLLRYCVGGAWPRLRHIAISDKRRRSSSSFSSTLSLCESQSDLKWRSNSSRAGSKGTIGSVRQAHLHVLPYGPKGSVRVQIQAGTPGLCRHRRAQRHGRHPGLLPGADGRAHGNPRVCGSPRRGKGQRSNSTVKGSAV